MRIAQESSGSPHPTPPLTCPNHKKQRADEAMLHADIAIVEKVLEEAEVTLLN